MTRTQTTDLIATLCQTGDLKVWSLLVTLFGDAAMADGSVLSGPQISEILGRLQIKPEAQRVALHRLRKDGWITATRRGRIGLYGLSTRGRAETAAVAGRVYAPSIPDTPARYVILSPDGAEAPERALLLGPGRYLGPVPGGADTLSAPLPGALPPWVAASAVPEPLCTGLAWLWDALDHVPTRPEDPMTATAQRLVILHHWRRFALRLAPEAEALLGPDWVGAACRARVAAHLAVLPRLSPTAPAP